MKYSSSPFVVLALGLLAPACMLQPLNGDTVSDAATPVEFGGYLLEGGAKVKLQSAPSRSGPFVTFAHGAAQETGFKVAGEAVYPWKIGAEVPSWTTIDCTETVFVRAKGAGALLLTYDNAEVGGGSSGFDCIVDELAGGAGLFEAAFDCVSSDSPVVRLEGGAVTTLNDDVIIATQAEADAIACYTKIEGSLTIGDSTELTIALPNLTTVTGDLDLTFIREPTPGFIPAIRTIDLPLLASVGGDIALTYPGEGGDLAYIDVGLPAVTSVGGDVSVSLTTFNADMDGLTALTAIPGDLSIVSSGSDYTNGTLLSALTSVEGDVAFESSNTTTGLLRALASVGGSLQIEGAYMVPGPSNFDVLSTVGGDVTLRSMDLITEVPSFFQFPALQSVGGTLDAESAGLSDLRLGSETDALTIGGLRLHQNASLDALTPDGQVILAPSGPITITDNTNLGDCNADAFVADQTALGWTGIALVGGNGDC